MKCHALTTFSLKSCFFFSSEKYIVGSHKPMIVCFRIENFYSRKNLISICQTGTSLLSYSEMGVVEILYSSISKSAKDIVREADCI